MILTYMEDQHTFKNFKTLLNEFIVPLGIVSNLFQRNETAYPILFYSGTGLSQELRAPDITSLLLQCIDQNIYWQVYLDIDLSRQVQIDLYIQRDRSIYVDPFIYIHIDRSTYIDLTSYIDLSRYRQNIYRLEYSLLI